jgi:hypothetical protein
MSYLRLFWVQLPICTCSERQSSRNLHIVVECRASRARVRVTACVRLSRPTLPTRDRRPLAECADVCFVLYTPYYMDESNILLTYKRPKRGCASNSSLNFLPETSATNILSVTQSPSEFSKLRCVCRVPGKGRVPHTITGLTCALRPHHQHRALRGARPLLAFPTWNLCPTMFT